MKITEAQLRSLLDQVSNDEISFSKMVEILNETNKAEIIKANEVLRSCYQVAERKGEKTNWDGLAFSLKVILDEQHKLIGRTGPVKPPNFGNWPKPFG